MHMLRPVSVAVCLVLLSACSNSPMKDASQNKSNVPVENRSGSSSAQSNQVSDAPVATATAQPNDGQARWAELRDPNSPLSKRSIFFDYDQYVIKDEYKSLIEAHAKFLVSNPNAKMLVQGNADERGSREYNLALGQKRADATKQALTLLGVKEAQIESVSLGEEKPRNTGHDDTAFAENRRDDMLYSGEF